MNCLNLKKNNKKQTRIKMINAYLNFRAKSFWKRKLYVIKI